MEAFLVPLTTYYPLTVMFNSPGNAAGFVKEVA